MMRTDRVVLQFLVLIFIKINVSVARQSDKSLGVLSRLFDKNARSPLVLVIEEAPNSHNNLLRSTGDQNQDGESDEFFDDDDINNIQSMHYINDILRSTGDDTDPIVQKTKDKFEKALRSKCEKVIECEVKCRKKKKKDNCKKSCNEIYESICGNKKKEKDSCDSSEDMKCGQKFSIPCGGSGKRGKTLPPCW